MGPQTIPTNTPETGATRTSQPKSAPWEEETYRDDASLFESATEVRESSRVEPIRIAIGVLTIAVLGVAFATLLTNPGV